jgi:hypothetical protein
MAGKIDGVPDGWELVHANRYVQKGEYYIFRDGGVVRWAEEFESTSVYPIIRKIEKPAKYRPFGNAEEFKPHRDRWARVIKEDNNSGCDLEEWLGDSLKFQAHSENDACAPGGWLAYDQAFECFVFDDDGTPFGVRIDE